MYKYENQTVMYNGCKIIGWLSKNGACFWTITTYIAACRPTLPWPIQKSFIVPFNKQEN